MHGVSGSVSVRSSGRARTRSGGSAPARGGGRGGGDRSLRGSLRDNLSKATGYRVAGLSCPEVPLSKWG